MTVYKKELSGRVNDKHAKENKSVVVSHKYTQTHLKSTCYFYSAWFGRQLFLSFININNNLKFTAFIPRSERRFTM
jgi:hypothetical protein